ncbi:MAG: DUF2857 domain-containing protein [Candidatus Thiodiazotropha endolucinida]
MEGTKESDLITAVLLYAIRCLAEGDYPALRTMNFGPREIEALREMSLSDLYRIESLRVHCLQIGLDRQSYWPMMDNLRQQRLSEETQQTLIAADAPLEMMQTLFGLGPREYSRMRRMLSVDPSVGRPPEPDEEGTHRLWHAWVDRAADQATGPLTPQAYLELQTDTGLSMRAIWNLTQRWDQYGDLNNHGEPDAANRLRVDE